MNERRDYEFREHEKNIVAQLNEQIAIRKRIVVEAQERQCVNHREHDDRFRFFMRNEIVLIILQYNVRNERVRTMISLLIDSNAQNFDVIVIQKS